MILRLLLFNIAEFATYVTGTFVFFSASLLSYDSWQLNKKLKSPLARGLGYFLLASFYFSRLTQTSDPTIDLVMHIIKVIALVILFFSIFVEPILNRPDNTTPTPQKITTNALFPLPLIIPALVHSLSPFVAGFTFLIAIWYGLQATKGLIKELKPAAIAFVILGLAETVNIAFAWSDTTTVFLSQILADFSYIWIAHLALQLVGFLILGYWVWWYLRFRLEIQLFSIILGSILTVFVVATSLFSFLLLRNLERETLSHLKTDSQVFQYALDRLKLESLSHATSIASNTTLQAALGDEDRDTLHQITSEYLINLNLTTVAIIDSTGTVISRAENETAYGDSLSTDPVVASSLAGQPLSTVNSSADSVTPKVEIISSVPITVQDEVIGSVLVAVDIDNAFVDGIKEVTGLDTTIFANNIQVATTLTSPDGTTRNTGTLATDEKILETVLDNGQLFVGPSFVLNEPYYTAYSPLLSLGDQPVGMLFIGSPQADLLDSAQSSINSTFVSSAFVMIFSLIPAYFLSKYISQNTTA